jgi:hypothetical protein
MTVIKLVKYFPAFMEHTDSSLWSQVSANGVYPEPSVFSALSNYIPLRFFLCYSPTYILVKCGLFPSDFITKTRNTCMCEHIYTYWIGLVSSRAGVSVVKRNILPSGEYNPCHSAYSLIIILTDIHIAQWKTYSHIHTNTPPILWDQWNARSEMKPSNLWQREWKCAAWSNLLHTSWRRDRSTKQWRNGNWKGRNLDKNLLQCHFTHHKS